MRAPHILISNDRFRFVILAGLLSILVAACGGSGNKEELTGSDNPDVNIDQLLGIQDGGEQGLEATGDTSAPTGSEEDEVLRLLGIKKDDPATETAPAQPAFTDIDSDDPNTLRLRVRELQDDLSKRDAVISDLRSQVADRDRTISSLQAGGASRSVPRSQPVPAAATGTASGSYQDAYATYQARRYREAISMFSALLGSNVRQSLADNCQYWIGECYYALKNYDQAIVEFEKVFRYSNSNKSDDALLKLGLTYLRLNKPAAAKSQFELLIANHPRSEFVDLAQRHIDKL